MLQIQGHTQINVRGWEKLFHVNRNQKKDEEVIFTPEKINSKVRLLNSQSTLHNDQEINQRIRYNSSKYIHSNMGIPQYISQILRAMKGKSTVTK